MEQEREVDHVEPDKVVNRPGEEKKKEEETQKKEALEDVAAHIKLKIIAFFRSDLVKGFLPTIEDVQNYVTVQKDLPQLDVVEVHEYLQQRVVRLAMTSKEKAARYVREQAAPQSPTQSSSIGSRSRRSIFTTTQNEAIKRATASLANNATMAEITTKVAASTPCKEAGVIPYL